MNAIRCCQKMLLLRAQWLATHSRLISWFFARDATLSTLLSP
jgi:hypothetical protein